MIYFSVSLPLQTALLNSDLYFWGLSVWVFVPCEPSRAKIILKKTEPQKDSLLFLLPSVLLAAWGSFPQCILLVGYSYYRPQECQNCLLFLNFKGTHFAGKCECIFDHFWTSAWHTVVCYWAELGLGSEISAKSPSPGKLYIKAFLWSSRRVNHSITEWPRLKKTSKMI